MQSGSEFSYETLMGECLTFYGVTFTYSTKFEQNISRSKRYICCPASSIPAGYLKCAGRTGARMHERINGSVVEICKISINVQIYVKYLYVHMITSDPNVFFFACTLFVFVYEVKIFVLASTIIRANSPDNFKNLFTRKSPI